MRVKSSLTIFLLVSLILAVIVLPSMVSAQSSSTATITGRVTYQGNEQDGATVTIVGGSSDTTKNGGYYNLSVVPNIAVVVTASFAGASVTKTVTAGDAGSAVTQNFDLAPLPTATPVSQSLGPNTATIVGTVRYNGNPLSGMPVNISPVTTVITDNAGIYRADVPGNLNVTVSVVTGIGSASQTVVTPATGNMVVNLNVTEGGAATATPVLTATPSATTTAVISATPASTPTSVPTVSPTAIPATPTAAPAGSESLLILAIAGLAAAVGLIGLRRV